MIMNLKFGILNKGTQYIIISGGESRDVLLYNEPNTDWHFVQEEGSTLRLHIICLSTNQHDANKHWYSSIVVEQNGRGCRTELLGMGLLYGTQQTHIRTTVLHKVGGGYSSQLFKFVLGDQTKGSFHGELKILPDAQQTEAYQTNRNILLSRQAEMLTEPQLEIYADDVKASHGATTGQLDESALFYMQQRCIDRDTASKLLLCAFFDDVIKTIADEQLQDRILEDISQIV